MRKGITFYVISAIIILGILGIGVSLFSDPSGFLQMIAISAIIIAVIFFFVQRAGGSGPGKNEQKAFKQAAKKSKKRYMQKETNPVSKTKTASFTSSIKKPKKKSTAHLTVIEGKKNKKKNRASF